MVVPFLLVREHTIAGYFITTESSLSVNHLQENSKRAWNPQEYTYDFHAHGSLLLVTSVAAELYPDAFLIILHPIFVHRAC